MYLLENSRNVMLLFFFSFCTFVLSLNRRRWNYFHLLQNEWPTIALFWFYKLIMLKFGPFTSTIFIEHSKLWFQIFLIQDRENSYGIKLNMLQVKHCFIHDFWCVVHECTNLNGFKWRAFMAMYVRHSRLTSLRGQRNKNSCH